MLFILIILAVSAAGFYFYMNIKEKQRYFQKHGIPHEKPSFLFGSAWDQIRRKENMTIVLSKLYDKSIGKRLYGIYHGTVPFIIIRDPELIGATLVKDFSNFHDRGIVVNEDVNPLEGHLFNIGGLRWKVLRSKLSPTFTSGKIRGMLSLMDQCTDRFIDDLDKLAGQEVNVKNEFLKLTAHIIGSCTFGIETDSIRNEKSEFIQYGLKIIQPDSKEFLKLIFRFFFPSLDKKFLKLKVVPQKVNDFFFGLVKDTMDYRMKSGYSRNDFLQLLLELREKGEVDVVQEHGNNENESFDLTHPEHKETIVMTDNVLTAQAAVFLAAGFETTSTTLSFMAYLLSKNQEAQDKLREEVRRVKNKFGSFTYDSLKEMHYLDAVINETMRLWPPIGNLIRTCNKTTKLADDILIEKGIIISIPVYSIQRDPIYYPDPESFKPERFIEDSIPNHTFLPFGGGPRNCIGERFARLELKITAAKFLEKFTLHSCPKMEAIEPIKLQVDSFVNVPQDGIYCRIKRIES